MRKSKERTRRSGSGIELEQQRTKRFGVMDHDDDFRLDLDSGRFRGWFESNKPWRKILKPSPSFEEQGQAAVSTTSSVGKQVQVKTRPSPSSQPSPTWISHLRVTDTGTGSLIRTCVPIIRFYSRPLKKLKPRRRIRMGFLDLERRITWIYCKYVHTYFKKLIIGKFTTSFETL